MLKKQKLSYHSNPAGTVDVYFLTALPYSRVMDGVMLHIHVHVHVLVHKNIVTVGLDKPVIPGQWLIELVHVGSQYGCKHA